MSQERVHAVGRRKNSVARVWMSPGEGRVVINKRPVDEYFGRETLKMIINQPLALTNTLNQYDIYILANGGGISGQAGAIRHGISRALEIFNPAYRGALKKAGFITRDARKKERKKYGQKGARARYQYSKR